jgi:mRNA interferase RelE/StbE
VLRPSDRYLVNRPLPPKPACQAALDLHDSYKGEVARRAVKALSTLPRRDQQRIRAAIDLLADEPRPPRCTRLAGESRTYRVRTGDYRIVYDVFDDRLVVQGLRICHRRDVYRH